MRHEHEVPGLIPTVMERHVVYVAQHSPRTETVSVVAHIDVSAQLAHQGEGGMLALEDLAL